MIVLGDTWLRYDEVYQYVYNISMFTRSRVCPYLFLVVNDKGIQCDQISGRIFLKRSTARLWSNFALVPLTKHVFIV